MSKPDAPTPPNPLATAAAQTGTNVSTGVANAYLNNVNQNTPQGSLRYDVTGSHEWTDPSTKQTYTIPTFTSTQTYGFDPTEYLRQNPDVAASGMDPYQHYQQYGQREGRAATGELGLYNTGLQTKQNLANIGQQQSARVGNLLSTPFDPSNDVNPDGTARTPGGGQAMWLSPYAYNAKTSYDPGGQIQSTFGDAGDITRSYGAGDFSEDRQKVEDALMGRINPQLARERGNIEQRLADQGIRYGSQAYQSAMDDYNRQATDTRFGAISQAGSEQQRMMDMAAQRAGFQNSAQQQQYDQLMGRGSFANQAQAQQNAQNASAAGFHNAGSAQQLAGAQSVYNAANATRNQYMQEQYAQRNQPLNEITSLMGGSQIQQPNWLNSPSSQIATTDIGGLINQNFAQQQQNYQTATSSWNATMGGLLGLGAAGIKASDRRVKKNVDRIGTVFAASNDGEREKLPIYEYDYKQGHGTPGRHVGPMAQDVERLDRDAVKTIGGVKHIDTGRVMGSILRAA